MLSESLYKAMHDKQKLDKELARKATRPLMQTAGQASEK